MKETSGRKLMRDSVSTSTLGIVEFLFSNRFEICEKCNIIRNLDGNVD